VRAQVDHDLTNVSCFDRLLGLIKNPGCHSARQSSLPCKNAPGGGAVRIPEEHDSGSDISTVGVDCTYILLCRCISMAMLL
jgi:hypothetical protein